MSNGIPVQVALVDATGRIDHGELQAVAGALNEQIHADFSPVWKVRANVAVYASVPPSTWQIQIQAKLDEPGALGYHTDDHNQPISYVELTTSDWPVTVSHEALEMLADPFGNRMHTAQLPENLSLDYKQFGLEHATSRVHYLLEVCDPCERTSYEVGGVALSDFLVPAWYRTAVLGSGPYSHAGGCTAPRQVADGGYVSFATKDGTWWQVISRGGTLHVNNLGKFNRQKFGSLREFSDHHVRAFRNDGAQGEPSQG